MEEGIGEWKVGVGDYEIQSTLYKINKHQGYIAQYRKYDQYFITTLKGV